MRLYLVLGLLTFPATAAAQQFTVTNRTPAFVVTNRTSALPITYSALLARVQAGERLTLAVGVPDAADGYVDRLAGFSPAVYLCWLRDGTPVMEPRVSPKQSGAASATTPGTTAPSAVDPSTSSAGSTPTAPTITLARPVTRGNTDCPDGRCPLAQPPTRRRLFP